ncbi:hypothetical protein JCM8547_001704 [Rhodosporidiobolus lusitaniae]
MPALPVNKAAAPPNPSKRSKASEIDDIFSSAAQKKPKLSAASPAQPDAAGAPATSGAPPGGKKKKNKKGKAAAGGGHEGETAGPSTAGAGGDPAAPPKRIPVEVVDTSKTLDTYKPEVAPMATKVLGPNATEEEKKAAAEEEERFMDSRGTRRKTEDGLPIYDTTELKIGLGGDTELCPFDCDCCF